MPRMFGKVFLAFWGCSILVVVAVGILSFSLGSRPLLQLWLTHSLDLYAQTASDLYEHGGTPTLTHYLDDIKESSAIDGTLVDSHGNPLAQHLIPFGAQEILEHALSSRQTSYDMRNWMAAIVVHGRGDDYVFVAHVHPWRRRQIAFRPSHALARASVGFVVATILCLMMARYLTKPMRDLQGVARRIAAEDLTARATPLLGARHDELAELAFDFDLMAEKVQMLIERQQTLLRDISHELRSPLARLTLSAELVRRGDLEAATRMNSDIRRLEALISELLTLSRIEASEHIHRDHVNLAEMARQIVKDATFEGRAEGKDLIQTGLKEIMVLGDANLLQRCLENVIRNAVRHTRPNTTIEVHLDRAAHENADTDFAAVRVIDEGPGVPPEALPHLFEPFFRVSQSREQQEGGAGLGLSISQRIAALHGGHIEASNRPEGGLEVTIYFSIG